MALTVCARGRYLNAQGRTRGSRVGHEILAGWKSHMLCWLATKAAGSA